MCHMFFELLGPFGSILNVFYFVERLCGNVYPNNVADENFDISLMLMMVFENGNFSTSDRRRKFLVGLNPIMWVFKSFLMS